MDEIFRTFYERLNSEDYSPADFETFLKRFNEEREKEMNNFRSEIETLRNEIEVLKGLNPDLETSETEETEEVEEILTYENLFN